jgi:hypothetical protein
VETVNDEAKPFRWEVQIAKVGRKAFNVSVVAFIDKTRPHLQSSGPEFGCVVYSLACKKGMWSVRQGWPTKPHITAAEATQVRELKSEFALARLEGLLKGYIAALHLGYRP